MTVALCFGVAVLEGFDIQALGVAAPRLAPEFGLNPARMGWLFAISGVGILIGASGGGWLADRLGRKPVFLTSVATFGAFTFAMTLASSFEVLFVTRMLAGLGFGAALPNMMAIAVEISVPARRALTSAAMFCGMPLGGALSAWITQLLPTNFDWRVLFELGGILPLVLLPAIYFYMPETLRDPLPGAAPTRPAMSLYQALFGNGRARATLLLWSIFLPTMLMLYMVLNWLPILVGAKGLDRSIAPQASLWFNLVSVVGALLLAPIVDRIGYRWPLSLAYLALAGVLVALAFATSVTAILLLSGLAGFLLLGATYSLYSVTAACYPLEARGTGSGASTAVGRAGSIVGPLLAGLLMARGLAADTVILALAPCATIAGCAVWALSRIVSASISD
jgi:AAHS family 3-hydroxyphenylpropionic acid transporter